MINYRYQKNNQIIYDLEHRKQQMIANRCNIEPSTGYSIQQLDEQISKAKYNNFCLEGAKLKDNVLLTFDQRRLYDSLEGAINDLNIEFAATYGPDIGIRQVNAYIQGDIGIEYIPHKYRDIISSYTQDELQEYLVFKHRIEVSNDFAKNGKMLENFTNTFSKYVDADKIAETANVNILASEEVFAAISNNPSWMAFNNGRNSYMNLMYQDDIIRANISHENIHQMSAKNGVSGIMIDAKHRGINEAFTEYLNKVSLGDDYPKEIYSGYTPMVDRLEFLVENDILTNDDIMSAYFSNDVSNIKNKINLLSGSDSFYDELVGAFEKTHDTKDVIDLDNKCRDLWMYKDRVTSGDGTLELTPVL